MSLDCPGIVSTDPVTGVPACHDSGGGVVAFVATPPFSFDQIDDGVAGSIFAAGFVMVGTAWAVGFGVAAVLKAIRR
jgi:hypothetical protein